MTSAPPAECEKGKRCGEPRRESESGDRPSPDRNRQDDRQALARDPAHPSGEDRADQGARPWSGVEKADRGRPTVKPYEPDRREQSPGHPEDHCVQIGDEGALQLLSALQIPEALLHRSEAESRPAALRRHGSECPHTCDSETANVPTSTQNTVATPDMSDEQTRYCRAYDDTELHEKLPQGRGAHEVVAARRA